MEFLPIKIDDNNVYAGFGRRLGAVFIDLLILAPTIVLFTYLDGLGMEAAIASIVISTILYSLYSIYFHYKFGATLGKMAVDIKVTLPNGSKIGFKHALLRSSVDLVYALLTSTAHVIALTKVNSELYFDANWQERILQLTALLPAWAKTSEWLFQLWFWSEFIVLLLNKRKRALHDFIAGTVVIHKEYAKD